MTDPLATRGVVNDGTGDTSIQRVVMTWKNHLDVGFTASEAKVVHDASRWHLPTAAALAQRLRQADGQARFCWTVPSWLAWHALETLEGAQLAAVEAGFAAGDLAWHGLPFTCHSELMDAGLAAWGLSLSQRLDARFGRRTRCAKQTDVPGHSLGLVGPLADAGIEVLHIGVNWMSAMPDVPPAFRWRDATGREVVVIYEGGYGDVARIPGDPAALLWQMVGDNMEVPSEADVRAAWTAAAKRFPGAVLSAGRMDDWAGDDLRARAASLPVVTGEIGDSWIHGTGTDPWKTQRLRTLLRLRRRWQAEGRFIPGSPGWDGFHAHLLLVAEHTWGVSMAAHTWHDERHWDNAAFARIRQRGCWRVAEASWQEQRDHIEAAIGALAPDLAREAEAACAGLAPGLRATAASRPAVAGEPLVVGSTTLIVDRRGALVSLRAGGVERIATGGALGLLRYRSYDDGDCRRYVGAYARCQDDWLLAEFAKRGLAGSQAVSRWWEPELRSLAVAGARITLDLSFAPEAVALAGAPASVGIDIEVGTRSLDFRLTWSGKHPTRLPEALWWSFQPRVEDPSSWRIDKLGALIDPAGTVARGGLWLHGIGEDVVADGHRLRFASPDAHLVALGEPLLYDFPDRRPDPAGGLHLNLVNNLWGTNFPMWCGDDLAFRASLEWG
jgi:hypothetical protein